MSIAHPALAATIEEHERRGDFLIVGYRPNSRVAGTALERHLNDSGLAAYGLEDRRWNGAGQTITARLNPVGLSFDRSDHAPFWRARIPAVVISDTAVARNPNYHRHTDTPDTLDYERMALAARAVGGVLTAELNQL